MAATAFGLLLRRLAELRSFGATLEERFTMFWYPYTGSIPMVLTWSAGWFTTGLAIAGLLGAVRLVLLTLRAPAPEAVSVPFDPVVLEDEPVEKQAAA